MADSFENVRIDDPSKIWSKFPYTNTNDTNVTTSKSKIVRTCSEIFGDPQKSNEMIFQSLLLLRWYRGSTKVTHIPQIIMIIMKILILFIMIHEVV